MMMQKFGLLKFTLFLLVALFSTNGITFSNAHADEYIDFITFAQLPKEDQRKLIKTAQELIVHYEQVQITEILKKEKYSSVRHVLNFLISSAYADNSKFANGSQKICIYAGWISYTDKTGNYCSHPLHAKLNGTVSPDAKKAVDKNMEDYNKLYNEPNGYKISEICKSEGTGTSAMICNPKMFGYRLDVNGKKSNTPFCSTGNKNPYNSSFKCLDVVKKYTESEAVKSGKTAKEIENQILDNIVSDGLKNPNQASDLDSLTNLLRLNYDICMCKGESDFISRPYADKMFKSRTCYAWLKQTRNILGRITSNSCNQLENINYPSSGKPSANVYSMYNWVDKAEANIKSSIKKYVDDEDKYFKYVEVKDPEWEADRMAEYANKKNTKYCPVQFDESIKADDTPSSLDGYIEIKARIIASLKTQPIQPETGWEFTYTLPDDCKDKTVVVDGEKGRTRNFKKINCDYTVTIKHDKVDGSDTITIPKIGTEVNNACTITIKDDRAYVVEEKLEDEDKKELTDEQVQANELNGKAITGLAIFTVSVKDDEDKDIDLSSNNFKINWPEGLEKDKEDKTKASYSKAKPFNGDVVVTLAPDTKYTCKADIKEPTKKDDDVVIDDNDDDVIIDDDDGEKAYTLELKQEDGDSDNVKVIATVKDKDGKEVTDLAKNELIIEWSKVTNSEDATTGDTPGGMKAGDDNTEAGEILDSGTKLTQEVEKTAKEQTVTADLILKDESIDKKSEDIAAKEATVEDVTPNTTNTSNGNHATQSTPGKGKVLKAPGTLGGVR